MAKKLKREIRDVATDIKKASEASGILRKLYPHLNNRQVSHETEHIPHEEIAVIERKELKKGPRVTPEQLKKLHDKATAPHDEFVEHIEIVPKRRVRPGQLERLKKLADETKQAFTQEEAELLKQHEEEFDKIKHDPYEAGETLTKEDMEELGKAAGKGIKMSPAKIRLMAKPTLDALKEEINKYKQTKPDGSPASIWDVEEPEKYKRDIFDEE